MDETRIRQAKQNYDAYLQEDLLVKTRFDKDIYKKYLDNSLESLQVAQETKNLSPLWTIVTSYYAMFYIANAYLYKKGYKTKHKIVHKIIADALITLARKELEEQLIQEYEEEKDKALSLAQQLLDEFEYERAKRSTFQYEMTKELKETKAETSLNRAKNFVKTFRELLKQ